MMIKDGSGRVFFSVSGDGQTPISIQRKLFGEVFYCLALLGMVRATRDQKFMVSVQNSNFLSLSCSKTKQHAIFCVPKHP